MQGSLVSVEGIVRQFWSDYGRVYYQRYDYEGVEGADKVIAEVLLHSSRRSTLSCNVVRSNSSERSMLSGLWLVASSPVASPISRQLCEGYVLGSRFRCVCRA